MADQLQGIVGRMIAAGESEENIAAVIRQMSAVMPAVSHGEAEARPIATGGGRGTGLDVRKSDAWAKENAPVIGATLATTATGGGALPMILAAGAGGAAGSAMRGDDLSTVATQGAIQGGVQAGGMGAVKLLSGIAKIPYRAAIPKPILDKFSKSDLAAKGIKDRVVLGTTHGADRASAANARAGAAIGDAAESVTPMSARDVQTAFGPKYNKALTGGKIDKANEINAHVRKSMDEIGPGEFTGRQQLARKEFLEQESKPAMAVVNSNMAATNPQLANIERRAIVQNLRRSPRMASALNESQASIGLDRAAQATQNSSIANRMGGGWLNMAKSPVGLSSAGVAINEGRRVVDPRILRLMDLIMSGGSQ